MAIGIAFVVATLLVVLTTIFVVKTSAQADNILPPAFEVLTSGTSNDPQKYYSYKIIATYDHDPGAFTQGLFFDRETRIVNGQPQEALVLYESTGLYGLSEVRKTDLITGNVLNSTSLNKNYFGEGLTEYNGQLYQLTWLGPKGFVYDKQTLQKVREFSTGLSDGWGIEYDGQQFIVTDGSTTMSFFNPQSMELTRQVTVTDGTKPVKRLNEIEYINTRVWGNIWQRDCIARVNPASGQVEAWVDVRGLKKTAAENASPNVSYHMDVLNGIAFDKALGKLYVTGKNWPKLFEIELVEVTPEAQQIAELKSYCIKK